MAEEIKFTEEELKTVKEIQETYISIQNEFGSTAMKKLKLLQEVDYINQYEEDLTKNFEETQDKEKKFLEEVTKKYGDGTLNPNTGIYTPAK